MMARLGDVCESASSNLLQKDLEGSAGEYAVYGASGFIKNVDFFQRDEPYIAIIKDGAGVGRVMKLPGKTSVIGTMQYILPKANVNIDYLAYAMEYMNLGKYYTGATIPHIYFKDYKRENLKLPPLDRQREIAAVLDKLSELSAKRRSQLDKLDELIKARFVEMFGDPVINQKNWPVQKLSIIADYFIGLTYKPSDVAEDGIIVLRSSNIQHNRIVLDDVVRVNTKIRPSLLVKKNDILMCSRNGSSKLVGKVARIAELQEEMTFGAFMTIIRSKYYDYLLVYFQMKAFRMQMSASKTSTINQITKKMLDDVQLPFPPHGLQQQFASFAECVEKQKSAINRSLAKLETLKKSLMQEYFDKGVEQ